jgi:glycosyltransferase involved in cell wall biosynthesis
VPELKKLRIAMLVVDANDSQSLTHRDDSRRSPVVHMAIQNLLEGLQSRDDIEVTVLYGCRHAGAVEERREGSIHYLPVPYRPLPVPGMGGPLLGRTFALLRALRKLKPDLVHGQGTERESGLVAACCGLPSILTLHGNLSEIAKSVNAKPFSYFWLAAKIEQWILPRVTLVHCLSTHTRASVAAKARQTRIIPNAVATPYFLVVRNPSKHPSVVCMAGIAEWKNPLLLVEASDSLHREYPETRIHFYGSCNPEAPYGRAFLESIQQRPWCVHHGQCSQDTLQGALATASCSVLPSKQENFGLALAEAMAAGVPVLGANSGGIPDVIRHNETGLLFEPDRAEELAAQLIQLHSDPPRMQQLSAAGKNEAISRFSVESVSAEHVAMYRQTLGL